MASTEGLVPITREYLSAYYDQYPLDPVAPDAERCDARHGKASWRVPGPRPTASSSLALALALARQTD